MIFTAVIIIWAVITITNMKRYNITRDEYYTRRLNNIENIMKEEFKQLINLLK